MFQPFAFQGTKASSNGPLTTAFLTATGISDSTIISSLNTMETDLSTAGLTSKLLTLYPLVGGTAATTQYNFMDTSAYNVTWNGTNVFSSNGVQSDGTSYGATGATLTGSLAGYYQTGSFGAYLEGSNILESPLGVGPVNMTLPVIGNKAVRYHWFNYTAPANSFYADAGYAGSHMRCVYNGTASGSMGITVERLAPNSYRQSFSFEGAVAKTNTDPENDADRSGGIADEFRLLKRKDGFNWDTTPLRSAWMGGDMDQTELNAMTTIISTFNTNLGRNY
tara:strand:+ start:79 stop:915 length:837 start_codon:yes stop_codon:yes gene_type:complete